MVKSVLVKVPGTCGEWIQTFDATRGKECLVSLPIDLYNEMKVFFCDEARALGTQKKLMPKSLQAFDSVCRFLNLPTNVKNAIAFESIQRELHIGKGMASSTADILCILHGVSTLCERPIESEKLLALCCEIEPTDGTMFKDWQLVDHLEGEVLESFGPTVDCDILLLSPKEAFETQKLRKNSQYQNLLLEKSPLPLTLFRQGMTTQDLSLLGRAATQSLIENEPILKKPHLSELIRLSHRFGCHGVVGGHSGTVAGLILNEEKTDLEALCLAIAEAKIDKYYQEIKVVKAISGGCSTTILEA